MKSRLKITSIMLLFALVLSMLPALALPSQASAAACYQAQFVADVTVPDGSKYNPDTAFKKTWKLKNIGTCAWSKTDVSMFFDSGTQMGAPASVPLPSDVAVGGTVEITVEMKAPSAAGHYIGYWKFKGAQGTIFGIGVNASKAWWVEINVNGSSGLNVVYDFTANAGSATWNNGVGNITFPGTDGDAAGFGLKKDKLKFESGTESTEPGLLMAPRNITNGFIQATYPAFAVQSGDRFHTIVGCEYGATSCYVAYRLDYEMDGVTKTYWTFRERYEGLSYTVSIDLTPLAGKNIKFTLVINSYGSPTGDRALWVNPAIIRQGAPPPPTTTGTPATSTPTKTPSPVTVTVPPSTCDKVQFVADVNYPDGTVLQPGAQFTKTWQLKNIGTCAWVKDTYQIVFFSGEIMGASTALRFAEDVPVGKTAKFSVNMIAPSAAGSYRGYWMFKNASGVSFGIGAQGNKPWWVDIKVSGPTVTPGGPTVTPSATNTPGGPTVTPAAGVFYDFAVNACNGTWFSNEGQLLCPGTDGDAKGFVLKVTNPKLETGATDTRPTILTFPSPPKAPDDGKIQGFFPAFKVQSGDRFRSTIGCEYGATNCYAAFRLDYQTGTEPIKTLWGPFLEKYEGSVYNVDVDLTPLAGKDVKFILTVLSAGTATGDRALWVGPHIYRASATNLPDLMINSVAVDLQNPGCLLPDARLGLRISISNKGQAAAGSFVVKSGDLQETVSGLAAGETKTVFLANYVSSTGATVTATVDATNVIAESNEQNNTFSGQIPVPTQPLPCTATPSPAASTYQNTKYNFKFTLPTGAVIAGQADTVGRVNLPFASGTNLTEKYIQVNVVENANPCISPAMNAASAANDSFAVSNIQFTRQTGQDVALGNIYDWVAYSTVRNNACISLTFIMHSINPANQATPPPVFDKNAESAVFTTIMNSFNWITP